MSNPTNDNTDKKKGDKNGGKRRIDPIWLREYLARYGTRPLTSFQLPGPNVQPAPPEEAAKVTNRLKKLMLLFADSRREKLRPKTQATIDKARRKLTCSTNTDAGDMANVADISREITPPNSVEPAEVEEFSGVQLHERDAIDVAPESPVSDVENSIPIPTAPNSEATCSDPEGNTGGKKNGESSQTAHSGDEDDEGSGEEEEANEILDSAEFVPAVLLNPPSAEGCTSVALESDDDSDDCQIIDYEQEERRHGFPPEAEYDLDDLHKQSWFIQLDALSKFVHALHSEPESTMISEATDSGLAAPAACLPSSSEKPNDKENENPEEASTVALMATAGSMNTEEESVEAIVIEKSNLTNEVAENLEPVDSQKTPDQVVENTESVQNEKAVSTEQVAENTKSVENEDAMSTHQVAENIGNEEPDSIPAVTENVEPVDKEVVEPNDEEGAGSEGSIDKQHEERSSPITGLESNNESLSQKLSNTETSKKAEIKKPPSTSEGKSTRKRKRRDDYSNNSNSMGPPPPPPPPVRKSVRIVSNGERSSEQSTAAASALPGGENMKSVENEEAMLTHPTAETRRNEEADLTPPVVTENREPVDKEVVESNHEQAGSVVPIDKQLKERSSAFITGLKNKKSFNQKLSNTETSKKGDQSTSSEGNSVRKRKVRDDSNCSSNSMGPPPIPRRKRIRIISNSARSTEQSNATVSALPVADNTTTTATCDNSGQASNAPTEEGPIFPPTDSHEQVNVDRETTESWTQESQKSKAGERVEDHVNNMTNETDEGLESRIDICQTDEKNESRTDECQTDKQNESRMEEYQTTDAQNENRTEECQTDKQHEGRMEECQTDKQNESRMEEYQTTDAQNQSRTQECQTVDQNESRTEECQTDKQNESRPQECQTDVQSESRIDICQTEQQNESHMEECQTGEQNENRTEECQTDEHNDRRIGICQANEQNENRTEECQTDEQNERRIDICQANEQNENRTEECQTDEQNERRIDICQANEQNENRVDVSEPESDNRMHDSLGNEVESVGDHIENPIRTEHEEERSGQEVNTEGIETEGFSQEANQSKEREAGENPNLDDDRSGENDSNSVTEDRITTNSEAVESQGEETEPLQTATNVESDPSQRITQEGGHINEEAVTQASLNNSPVELSVTLPVNAPSSRSPYCPLVPSDILADILAGSEVRMPSDDMVVDYPVLSIPESDEPLTLMTLEGNSASVSVSGDGLIVMTVSPDPLAGAPPSNDTNVVTVTPNVTEVELPPPATAPAEPLTLPDPAQNTPSGVETSSLASPAAGSSQEDSPSLPLITIRTDIFETVEEEEEEEDGDLQVLSISTRNSIIPPAPVRVALSSSVINAIQSNTTSAQSSAGAASTGSARPQQPIQVGLSRAGNAIQSDIASSSVQSSILNASAGSAATGSARPQQPIQLDLSRAGNAIQSNTTTSAQSSAGAAATGSARPQPIQAGYIYATIPSTSTSPSTSTTTTSSQFSTLSALLANPSPRASTSTSTSTNNSTNNTNTNANNTESEKDQSQSANDPIRSPEGTLDRIYSRQQPTITNTHNQFCHQLEEVRNFFASPPGGDENRLREKVAMLERLRSQAFSLFSHLDGSLVHLRLLHPSSVQPGPTTATRDVNVTAEEMADYFTLLIETTDCLRMASNPQQRGPMHVQFFRICRILNYFMIQRNMDRSEAYYNYVLTVVMDRPIVSGNSEGVSIVQRLWDCIRRCSSPSDGDGARLDHQRVGVAGFRERIAKYRAAMQKQAAIAAAAAAGSAQPSTSGSSTSAPASAQPSTSGSSTSAPATVQSRASATITSAPATVQSRASATITSAQAFAQSSASATMTSAQAFAQSSASATITSAQAFAQSSASATSTSAQAFAQSSASPSSTSMTDPRLSICHSVPGTSQSQVQQQRNGSMFSRSTAQATPSPPPQGERARFQQRLQQVTQQFHAVHPGLNSQARQYQSQFAHQVQRRQSPSYHQTQNPPRSIASQQQQHSVHAEQSLNGQQQAQHSSLQNFEAHSLSQNQGAQQHQNLRSSFSREGLQNLQLQQSASQLVIGQASYTQTSQQHQGSQSQLSSQRHMSQIPVSQVHQPTYSAQIPRIISRPGRQTPQRRGSTSGSQLPVFQNASVGIGHTTAQVPVSQYQVYQQMSADMTETYSVSHHQQPNAQLGNISQQQQQQQQQQPNFQQGQPQTGAHQVYLPRDAL